MITKVLYEVDGVCDSCCEILEPFEPIYRDEEMDMHVCGKCLKTCDNVSQETIIEAEKEKIVMRYKYYQAKYDDYKKLLDILVDQER